jgi:hypothetical protein
MDQLARALGIVVRHANEADRSDPDLPALTPTDPSTGDVGVVLRVVSVESMQDNACAVAVTYARSGRDGGAVTLHLVCTDAGWSIADVWPDDAVKPAF